MGSEVENGCGVAVIRSMDDAREFSVIEPIERASIAGFDHGVAGTGVEVGFHLLAAMRAGKFVVQVVSIGAGLNDGAALNGV
jgi:hypothetical protein